ncbi:protein LZIC-like [Amphibalanus amphitrite]|uniref:protein LZIC-like n=1 Tax=Amphibalanus amphitrite TaxID=1232801 RepID=UPI001C92201C|nr:protein LZIC-like [Amphibalanus amphitrite]XP_043222824.1 protein LZIC-like [Amphibalanus amphitrite]XP_043222825.1 protein LZIC-like [Amphibalanus amphitrite]XP_043222826.1 protein LZIC-like [Amphibalanus amphitrite]
MATRGVSETEKLQKNLTDQLDRLMSQLQDLEDSKDDLDADEYNETRQDTIEQLKEFQQRLSKFSEGDLSLVDQFGATQLAIQAAITEAFRTPEIIGLFARRQPEGLRQRLSQLERDHRLGHLAEESFSQQRLEILSALKKLGEPLTPEEVHFMTTNTTDDLRQFLEDDMTVSSERVVRLAQSGLSGGT